MNVKFIKPINEAGMFKTPAQVKRQMAADAEIGDEEIISKMASEIFYRKYTEYIKSLLKKRGCSDFEFAFGFDLTHLLDTEKPDYDYGDQYNMWLNSINVQYDFNPAEKIITVNISFGNAEFGYKVIDKRLVFAGNAMGNCLNYAKYRWSSNFINDAANYIFKRMIEDALKDAKTNVERDMANSLGEYTINVNKASLFAGQQGDVKLDFITSGYADSDYCIDDKQLDKIRRFFGEIFSFDNIGKVYIRYYNEDGNACAIVIKN